MGTVITALSVLLAIFVVIAAFLAKEMLKKFGFQKAYVESAPDHLVQYRFPGAKATGHAPGMRNIILRSHEHFSLLIGFELTVGTAVGFDHFGFAHAKAHKKGYYEVIVCTYMGNAPVAFQFLSNKSNVDARVEIDVSEQAQFEAPHQVFEPHWWQTLGFWG